MARLGREKPDQRVFSGKGRRGGWKVSHRQVWQHWRRYVKGLSWYFSLVLAGAIEITNARELDCEPYGIKSAFSGTVHDRTRRGIVRDRLITPGIPGPHEKRDTGPRRYQYNDDFGP